LNIIQLFFCFVKTSFLSKTQKDLEILALRSQLAVLQEHLLNQKITRPRVNNRFRRLWVYLSKVYPDWKKALMIFQPDTIIRWHKRAFKIYWRRKSRVGRPKISPATIALIKRIHNENPLLLYVFLLISHGRRQIEGFAVTQHPTAQWLTQQLRNATAFGHQPKYLIHDNG